jgi:hypothetical protein
MAMDTIDRLLELASEYLRSQGRAAAREADRLTTAVFLQLVAGGLAAAALTVLLVSLYLLLAPAITPAGALGIIGLILGLIAACVSLFAYTVSGRL